MSYNIKEYILCAAVRRKEPRQIDGTVYDEKEHNDILNIEIGYRHHDIYTRFPNELKLDEDATGFYTSNGRFVDRYEGMEIAYKAGQVNKKTALDKSWHTAGFFGDEAYWNEHDKHEYNMLTSEDLY